MNRTIKSQLFVYIYLPLSFLPTSLTRFFLTTTFLPSSSAALATFAESISEPSPKPSPPGLVGTSDDFFLFPFRLLEDGLAPL